MLLSILLPLHVLVSYSSHAIRKWTKTTITTTNHHDDYYSPTTLGTISINTDSVTGCQEAKQRYNIYNLQH